MTTLNYRLDKEDFLRAELFRASHSARIRKIRRRTRILIPLLFLLGCLLFYALEEWAVLIFAAAVALLWFLFFPLFYGKHIRRQYAKAVDELYRIQVQRPVELRMDEQFLISSDEGGEGKIRLSEVDHLSVIDQAVYIRLKTGKMVILPRKKLDPDTLETFLSHLESSTGIQREILDWSWA